MKAKIYHNPRCSKSRETLKLLHDHNVDASVILYLETPPTQTELTKILKYLKKDAVDIIRFKEKLAKELGLSARDQRKNSEWLRLIAKHPILLERPIVIVGKQAVVGRPPENVLQLFMVQH